MVRGLRQNQSERRYWCRIFQTRQDLVGAICDERLLGKKLKDERFEITVTKNFYGGLLVSERVAVRILGKISIGNIIGADIVDAAKKNGFITEENIILIDGVPHAQFVNLQA